MPVLSGSTGIESISIRTARWLVAVRRRPNGDLVVGSSPMPPVIGVRAAPFIRGPLMFLESIWPPVSATVWAERGWVRDSEKVLDEDCGITRYEQIVELTPRSHPIMAIVFAALFFWLPQMLVDGALRVFGHPLPVLCASVQATTSLVGVSMLCLYCSRMGRIPEIARAYQYANALLRAISAWDTQQVFSIQVLRHVSPAHPSSGAFLICVDCALAGLLSWTLGLILPEMSCGWIAQNCLVAFLKVVFFPLLASIASELSYLLVRIGKRRGDFGWLRAVFPIQSVVLRPPDDAQLEVAYLAVTEAVRREAGEE